MAMVHCSSCNRETLNKEGRCVHCNNRLKFSIWKRKLRRHEAYGFILVVLGASLLLSFKIPGVLLFSCGAILIMQGLVRPRVPLSNVGKGVPLDDSREFISDERSSAENNTSAFAK